MNDSNLAHESEIRKVDSVTQLDDILSSARERLAAVPRERLGSVKEPGRIRRALGGRAAIVPAAEAWHVGVLLIGDDALWRTGSVLRASEEVRRGYAAESQRERAAIAPVFEAWHVGVLLVGDDALWRTGSVLRASEEVRRGYAAESQRERAGIRAMALRGGIAEGETFHYDWAPITGPDDEPLARDGSRLMIRWSPAGFLMPLADYLAEQISLLTSGPRS